MALPSASSLLTCYAAAWTRPCQSPDPGIPSGYSIHGGSQGRHVEIQALEPLPPIASQDCVSRKLNHRQTRHSVMGCRPTQVALLESLFFWRLVWLHMHLLVLTGALLAELASSIGSATALV